MSRGRSAAPGVWAAALREARRIAARPLYPVLMLVLPVASFLLFWALFAQRVPVRLPIAVLDADRSALSRRLVRMVDATRTMAVAREVATMDDAERLVREGRAYAVLVVPAGLERDVRRGEAPRLVCYYNAQYILAASMIRRDLRAVTATLSGGVELSLRRAAGEAPDAALRHLEPIRLDQRPLFNPELSYLTFLFPALSAAMLQIFVLMTAVLAVGSELRDGTAREWLASAGDRPARAVLGKLLPYSLHYAALGVASLLALFGPVGLPRRGSFALLCLATVLFVLAAEAVGAFLVAAFASLRLASSAAAFYSGPAFAFCGLTFPTMAMPLAGRVWGALLPQTPYVRVTVDQTLHGAPAAVSLPPIAALAAFALVLPAIAVPRLARLATDERFWRRP